MSQLANFKFAEFVFDFISLWRWTLIQIQIFDHEPEVIILQYLVLSWI